MILIYFIKVNLCLALLCLLFQVLMYRDTFFGVRRLMLCGIYLTAFLLPLWNMQGWFAEGQASSELAEAYATYVLPTLNVTATRVASFGIEQSEPGCGMWFVGTMLLWALIYAVPVVVLALRFLWQLVYIIYLRITCRPIPLPKPHPLPPSPMGEGEACGEEGSGYYYYYPKPCSPFSFGPWIFMHTNEIDEQTLREVLVHEQTHVRQWHTADILMAEWVCILCWWNPAAWVMRREVRMNLEFLADKAVSDYLSPLPLGGGGGGEAGSFGGKALKAYQYHLLGFSTQMNVATISNNFNVLPLKRRIMMMNSRRTHRAGMVKYALFVPVAAALLFFSNIDSLARNFKTDPQAVQPEAVEVSNTDGQDDKKGQIYEQPEVMPEYPGGEQELYKFIALNVKYPEIAQKQGVQGRIFVTFIVEKDGSITEIKPLTHKKTQQQLEEVTAMAYKPDATPEQKESAKNLAEGLEQLKAEAVRVVSIMPKWKPGQHKDKPVRVRFTIPVVFKLQ